MQRFVPHPQRPTWNAHNSQIKELFGFRPEQKWPREGVPERLLTLNTGETARAWVHPLGRPGQPHRAMIACPGCLSTFTLGKFMQHRCSNPPQR